MYLTSLDMSRNSITKSGDMGLAQLVPILTSLVARQGGRLGVRVQKTFIFLTFSNLCRSVEVPYNSLRIQR